MPPRTDSSRQAIIEHLMQQVLPEAVVAQEKVSGDLILRDAHHELPLTVRSLGATSRVMVESAIVHAAAVEAHARTTGTQHRQGICLLLEKVSATTPDEVCGLLSGAKLPVIDILLVARHGRSWMHLPTFGMAGQWIDRSDTLARAENPEPVVRNVFTPANLWIFKAILYSGMKSGQSWWRHWKPDGWTSASELAKVGSLSVATVTRGLQSMAQRGWIAWHRGEPIRCLLRESAMASWIEHARVMSMHRERLGVAPAFDATDQPGSRHAIEWIAAQRKGVTGSARWAITGWHAADHHGMRIVSSIDNKLVTLVTDGSLRAWCDQWKLVPTHPRDALFIIEHDSDEHLQETALGDQREQEGRNQHTHGLRWVDPLQSAIDVARDPLQGQAQAEAIIDVLSRDTRP